MAAMRLELILDDHADEISFTLTRIAPDGSREILDSILAGTFQHDAGGWPYTYVYRDLPKDSQFELRVEDMGGNGICCDTGYGEILVFELDNTTGEEVCPNAINDGESCPMFISDGDFGAELLQTFPFPSVAPTVPT
jgi:hypothetical protein